MFERKRWSLRGTLGNVASWVRKPSDAEIARVLRRWGHRQDVGTYLVRLCRDGGETRSQWEAAVDEVIQ